MYNEGMWDGPASLYLHMTGKVRPQAPPQPGPDVCAPLPAAVYAGKLQVLGELLPTLLQRWGCKKGFHTNDKGTADLDTTGSTGGRNRQSTCAAGCVASISSTGSNSSSGAGANSLDLAVKFVGHMTLWMVDQLPATLMGNDASVVGSSARAAATSAGQLCDLLELICRAEMSVTQHCSNMKAAQTSCSSDSSSDGLCSVPKKLRFSMFSQFVHSVPSIGPLVDTIVAHNSPDSKQVKQLCSLLTTMLKVARHVSGRTPRAGDLRLRSCR
jgi:hypothetical protein